MTEHQTDTPREFIDRHKLGSRRNSNNRAGTLGTLAFMNRAANEWTIAETAAEKLLKSLEGVDKGVDNG